MVTYTKLFSLLFRFLMGRAGLDDGLEGQSVGIALAVREVIKENERLVGLISR